MYVHNISFQVDPIIESNWLNWIKNNFIPQLKQTNCFQDTPLYKLELTQDQSPTYTLQLFSADKIKMELFLTSLESELLQDLKVTWGEQCYHFCTNMEIVH